MAIIPTSRGRRPGRFHFTRLVRALQASPHCKIASDALRMALQLQRSLWTRPSSRRLLRTRHQCKWARDERHAQAIRHTLPARLRTRMVHVESYDD